MDVTSELKLCDFVQELLKLYGTEKTQIGSYQTDEDSAHLAFILKDENLFNVHTEEETYKALHKFTEETDGFIKFLEINRKGIFFYFQMNKGEKDGKKDKEEIGA